MQSLSLMQRCPNALAREPPAQPGKTPLSSEGATAHEMPFAQLTQANPPLCCPWRIRATFSQSITHPHSLYFISGPGILPLDSFMASKCPLTLNTEPWTRSLSGTDHRLLYPVSRVSQRRLCAWALVGDCDRRTKGWDDEVGGTRKGYNEMLGFS